MARAREWARVRRSARLLALGLLVAHGLLVAQAAHAQTSPDGVAPLEFRCDEFFYDARGSRIIVRGNVEMRYQGYILTADEVIYDSARRRLLAEGNARLRDDAGNVTRADHFEMTPEFRDAFLNSLAAAR